jgi:hypothetical protein
MQMNRTASPELASFGVNAVPDAYVKTTITPGFGVSDP